MLAFKFVTKEYMSPNIDYGKLDYSGPWPRPIEEKDCDPWLKGQCAKGIHVIPYCENINWCGVIVSDKIIMLEVDKKDIIYSRKHGKMRVRKANVLREATEEEKDFIRQEICKHSAYMAFNFAILTDKCARDDTRQAAYQDSTWKEAYKQRFGE